MLKGLLKKLTRQEWMSKMHVPKKGDASFQLIYKTDNVGYLNFKDGKWTFYYSDWFKNQNTISPIIDFPDKQKVYETDELWPFFSSRIPSIETPFVRKRVEKEKLDAENLLDMLKYFGYRSINNPYILSSL